MPVSSYFEFQSFDRFHHAVEDTGVKVYPARAVPHGSADHPAHQPRAIAHQKTPRLRHYPDIGREVANGCVDSRADLFDGGNGLHVAHRETSTDVEQARLKVV